MVFNLCDDHVDQRLLGILDQVLQKQRTYFDRSELYYVFVQHCELFHGVLIGSLHFVLDVLDEFIIRLAARVTVSSDTRVVGRIGALMSVSLTAVGLAASTRKAVVSSRVGLRLLGALRRLLLWNLKLLKA